MLVIISIDINSSEDFFLVSAISVSIAIIVVINISINIVAIVVVIIIVIINMKTGILEKRIISRNVCARRSWGRSRSNRRKDFLSKLLQIVLEIPLAQQGLEELIKKLGIEAAEIRSSAALLLASFCLLLICRRR